MKWKETNRMQPRKHLTNVLDTDKIGPLLFKLSTPAFMGMFVQSMYNVINTIFVGKYVGTDAIAGLGVAFPLQMLGFGLGNLAGIGGMSLISRYLGAREYEKAEKSLGNGIVLSIFLGLFIILALLPFLGFWLKLIGASEHVYPYAYDYMVFVCIGMLPQICSMAFLNYARAEGNARVGMIGMILGALTNIGLSALFIIGMHLGARGAGLATMIAQLVSVSYTASYYLFNKSFLKLRRINLRPDFRVLKQISSIGVGAFMQVFAGSLSSMILINMVVHYGGDYALGAFTIVQRVMMFANMPAMIISQGAQPILGFNYGARRFRLALKSIYMAVIVSTGLCTVTFGIVYFIPEPIIRIFSNDEELVSAGILAARGMMLLLPITGPMMVGTMVFQALGKPGRAFITAVARPVLFMIPAVLILSRLLGIDGIWYAFPTSDALTCFTVGILILPILSQLKKSAAEEDQQNVSQLSGQNGANLEPGRSHATE